MDKIKQIYNLLEITEKLKWTQRWLHTKEMQRKESTAAHSWNLTLLVFITATELNIDVDVNKAIKIALVHDLVEALAGDTDQSLIFFGKKTKEDKQNEELAAMKEIIKTAPKKSGLEIEKLWLEYEKAETREARFVKALDKIECINHMLCQGHENYDHPELIAPFPRKAVEKFPELLPMYQELLARLKPEYIKHGWEWKKEYEIS